MTAWCALSRFCGSLTGISRTSRVGAPSELDGEHPVLRDPNVADPHVLAPKIGDGFLDHLTISLDVSRGHHAAHLLARLLSRGAVAIVRHAPEGRPLAPGSGDSLYSEAFAGVPG